MRLNTVHLEVVQVCTVFRTCKRVKLESEGAFQAKISAKYFSIEFLPSLALGLGIPLIAENPTLVNNSPMAASLTISGLVVAVVLCALPLSGGIFNPMLGSVLFGGCEGHTWVSSQLLLRVRMHCLSDIIILLERKSNTYPANKTVSQCLPIM